MRLVAVTVVPVVVGMTIRARAAGATERLRRAVRGLATMLFLAVVVVIVGQNADSLRVGLRALGLPLAVLGVGSTTAGLLIATIARLARPEIVMVGIEMGMQNVATAAFVTATLLGDPTMALAPAVYAFIMLSAAGLLALASRALWTGVAGRRAGVQPVGVGKRIRWSRSVKRGSDRSGSNRGSTMRSTIRSFRSR